MRWIALAAGLAAGGINYALLVIGCKGLGKSPLWQSVLWLFGGIMIPVVGLALCAVIQPLALVWFGCGCGGILVTTAIVHMIIRIIRR